MREDELVLADSDYNGYSLVNIIQADAVADYKKNEILLTCEFDIDTACVELCFADGSQDEYTFGRFF